MKLPGVEYRQVESLGRFDTTAVARRAASEAGAADAKAGIARELDKQATIIYEAESTRQANKALNTFRTAYNEQEVVQEAYDENGVAIWNQRDTKFSEMNTNAMEASEDVNMTGKAREDFRNAVATLSVRNKAAWDNKSQMMWKRDGLAQASTQLADDVMDKDWDAARDTIDKNMVFIGPVQAANLKSGVQNKQTYDGFEIRIGVTDITNRSQGRKTEALLKDIESNKYLSDRDKKALTAKTTEEVVMAYRDKAMVIGKAVNDAYGPVKAYETLDTMLTVVYSGDHERFGGGIELQHRVHNAIKMEQQHFADAYRASSNKMSTTAAIANYGSANISKDYNEDIAKTGAALHLFGYSLNDNGTVDKDSKPAGIDELMWSGQKMWTSFSQDKGLISATDSMVEHVQHDHHITPEIGNFMSMTARNKGPEGVAFTLDFVHKLQATDTGRAALNSLPQSNDLKRLMAITEVMGVSDPKNVSKIFMQGLQRTAEEKKAYWDSRNRGDDREEFGKTLPDVIGKANNVGWFSKDLHTRRATENAVWALTQQYMEDYPNWSIEDATKAAVSIHSQEYSSSSVGAAKAPEFKRNAAER